MSDKPTVYEGVQAKQIEPGNWILYQGRCLRVESVKPEIPDVAVRINFFGGFSRAVLFLDDEVARIPILPVPQTIDPADRDRILVTACKLIANDKSIIDGHILAGYLLQLTRCGGAKPYEVKERTVET